MDVPIAEPRDAKLDRVVRGPKPRQRRGRALGMEVTRFCREQNRTAEGRPRSGASREGVSYRDVANKKNPGDKGRASGAEHVPACAGTPRSGRRSGDI